MSVIKLSPHHSGATRIEPATYLGDNFRHYISICKTTGAMYKEERGEKFQLAKMEILPELVNNLMEADFKLDIHPDIISAVQAVAARAREDKSAATARMGKINDRLAEQGKFLFPFQIDDIEIMSQRMAVINANPMGSGKTAETLLSCPEDVPVMVVCPAVAKGVWVRECEKWRLDNPEVVTLKGRQKVVTLPGEFTVLNYSILPPVEAIAEWEAPEGMVLIADECHLLKNNKSLRTQRFREISKKVLANKGRVYLLTGTPMLNRPLELWNVLQAADLHFEAFGSWHRFTKLFNAYKDAYGWVFGEPTEEVPRVLNRVMIRHEKEDILKDLPPKRVRYVEVDRLVKKALQSIPRSLAKVVDETWEGATFEELSEARAALAEAKIPAMMDFVLDYEEQEVPLVVASAHVAPIKELEGREGWAIITGATANDERSHIEDEFQAGRLKGVGLTIQAGGVAITLTRASDMLFVDEAWTPALNEQCRDRIHRIGQHDPCLYTILVADHWLDQRIAKLLAEKNRIIQGSINEAGRQHKRDRKEAANEFTRLAEVASNLEKPTMTAQQNSNRRAAESDKDRQVLDYLQRRVDMWGTEFFRSLITQHNNRGGLTKKQWQCAYEAYDKEDNYTLRPPDKARPAESKREHWIIEGLHTLCQLDPDHARDRNDMGFNATDSGWGRKVLTQYQRFEGLSEEQWLETARRLSKYHRQIGEMPDA